MRCLIITAILIGGPSVLTDIAQTSRFNALDKQIQELTQSIAENKLASEARFAVLKMNLEIDMALQKEFVENRWRVKTTKRTRRPHHKN